MMQRDMLLTAMQQSALDIGCAPEDFERREPVVVRALHQPRAKAYLGTPPFLFMACYGRNVAACAHEDFMREARAYLDSYDAALCFSMPYASRLDSLLRCHGMCVSNTASYYLPCDEPRRVYECAYPTRVLTQEDFEPYYLPQWSNAISKRRKHLDMLGVGAFDGDTLIALAGCSADCADMWQIGIDVLPEYRGMGIAKSLTSRLTAEILDRGKVPFYGAAWANIKSVRNAVACGYRPAWVELCAGPIAQTEARLNGK